MLQRDYIQRLIREFMAALQRLLEKKEGRDRQEAVRELYRQYLGNYELYHSAGMDEVMRSFESFPQEERAERMEMLAELYYAEADMLTEPTRTRQLERAYMLFDFIDRHGDTFSMERTKKMDDIARLINKNIEKGQK